MDEIERRQLIKQQIEKVLSEQKPARDSNYTKSLEQLIEELNTNIFELQFQNEELSNLENRVRRSENEYRLLFEEAPTGYAIIDEDFRVLKYNKSFQKLTDISSTLQNNDFRSLIHPDYQDDFIFYIKRFNQKDDFTGITFKLRAVQKEATYVKLKATLNTNSDEKQYLISMIDITDQVRVQSELKELNATKDKLFSIIAHDLRSPFMALLGISEIMVDKTMQLSMDEMHQLAGNMNHSAISAYNLLENLLEWSRIQRDVMIPEFQFCLLRKLVEECTYSFKDLVASKNLSFSINIPEKLLAKVDQRMMESVVRNLVTNAIKFTPRDGSITVDGYKAEAGRVILAVKDTGIGIPDSLIENIFDVDDSKCRRGTEGEKSTGLGLIITRELISRNNGKIWVNSIEGKGSTFYLELPGY